QTFCTSSERFAPSFVRQLNGPKCTQMVQNKILGSNGVDRVLLLRKILTRHRGTNFCTSSKHYPRVSQGNQMVVNAPKRYKMHQNMSLGSNRVDWVRSSRKQSDSTSWHELLH